MYKPLERAFEEKASDLWLRIALPGEEVKRNLVVDKAWKSEPVKAVVPGVAELLPLCSNPKCIGPNVDRLALVVEVLRIYDSAVLWGT